MRIYESFKRDWAKVFNNGRVQMSVRGILTVKFNIHLASYPYDLQNITMRFDLWNYTKDVAVLFPFEFPEEPISPIRMAENYYREDILW